jgi:hypothetical protein
MQIILFLPEITQQLAAQRPLWASCVELGLLALLFAYTKFEMGYH